MEILRTGAYKNARVSTSASGRSTRGLSPSKGGKLSRHNAAAKTRNSMPARTAMGRCQYLRDTLSVIHPTIRDGTKMNLHSAGITGHAQSPPSLQKAHELQCLFPFGCSVFGS